MYFDPPDLTLYDPDAFNRQAFIREKEALTVEQGNRNYGQLTAVNLWRSFQYFLTGFSVNDFTISSTGEIESTQPATFSILNATNVFVNSVNITTEIEKKRYLDDNQFPFIILNGHDLQETLDSKRDLDDNVFTEINLNGADLQETIDLKRDYDDNLFTEINLNGNDLQATLDSKRDYDDNTFDQILLGGQDLDAMLNSKRDMSDNVFQSITLNGNDLEELVDKKRDYDDTDFLSLTLNQESVATEHFVEERVSQIIGGVPLQQLDTIYELGNYLQNQENELTALVQLINTKSSIEYTDTKLTLQELKSTDVSFNGNIFFSKLPTSNAIPSQSNHLVNKQYVDSKMTLEEVQQFIETEDISFNGNIGFHKQVNYLTDLSFNNLSLVHKKYVDNVGNAILQISKDYADVTKLTMDDLTNYIENSDITLDGKITFTSPASYFFDPSFNYDLSLTSLDLVPKQFVENYVQNQFSSLPLEFDVGLVEVGPTADAFIEQDTENVNKWLLNLQLPKAQGFNYKFEWAEDTTYFAYDVVRYEKDSFVCIVPVTTNFNNPLESDEWDYFVQGGTDGVNGESAPSGNDAMVSGMTTAIVGLLAQSALNFVAQGIISGFQNAMMNMLGDKINNQIDDAVGEAVDQIDEENIKRKIKHIDAEPVSFEISEFLQPYTSVNSQLKITNDVNAANVVLYPDGKIESKVIQNQNSIETSVLNVNNELNVTDKAVFLGDTYLSKLKPLLTDFTNTISINGNLKLDSDRAIKTNNITARGSTDTLLMKAPYITFEIDPIVYNVVENPFDSLNPTEPQVILFKNVPQIFQYADEPSADLDIPHCKYVNTKVNNLKTNLENEVQTNILKTNSINTKGDRDELVIKAPYLTFELDPILYNELENPFDSLNPAPMQMILFNQVPKIDPYADPISLDIDMVNVKYVTTKLNELKTDLETKLDTTNTNVESYKEEIDSVKERVNTLEESVTSINNQLSQINTILENLTTTVEALTNELSDIGRLSQFDNFPPPDPNFPDYDQIYDPTENFTNFNPLDFRM